MINTIRKISLTNKLILIGLIPILLLIYFSIVIYQEKSQKLEVMQDYINQVEISADLARLNESLGYERLYSFQYLLHEGAHHKIVKQRHITDSIISYIETRPELALKQFRQYTFLTGLNKIRNQVDSFPSMDPNVVIDFYTRCIYRINYINSWIPPSNIYLPTDYQDLISQRLLREMITLIDILRTNIYNVLYTKKFMVETLIGSYGTYTMYESFQKEFDLKASPKAKSDFEALKTSPAFSGMNNYMDTLFSNFKFDSSFTASQWWQLSTQGINELKVQQIQLWRTVDHRLLAMYEKEKRALTFTIITMALAIILIVVFILYIIKSVRVQLRTLKLAARKISRGETGITLGDMPRGMLGNLAKSILQIEKNNLVLANAAGEIGKGNFGIQINPRSEQDILAMSIVKMKNNLEEFHSQKDRLQKETLQLVNQRDEFFSMTSHELKTPVTTLKAYTQMLLLDGAAVDNEQRIEIFRRMEKQINKLVALINDLLDTSRLQFDQLTYNMALLKLNGLVGQVVNEIQIANPGHRIIFQKNVNAEVCADADRISQVLNNLLTNAIKYGSDSRDIIVRMERTENTVICSVKDFGFGIRDEQKDKIFDRFYRVHGDNMHTYPGLGIGLYISREIIQKHKGKIWFESEFRKGSIFYFELPLASSPGEGTNGKQ